MKRILIAVLKTYKYIVSPLLLPSCRFTPTCSAYALDAITKYGCLKGTYLSFRRVLKCHPFCRGGHDPVV